MQFFFLLHTHIEKGTSAPVVVSRCPVLLYCVTLYSKCIHVFVLYFYVLSITSRVLVECCRSNIVITRSKCTQESSLGFALDKWTNTVYLHIISILHLFICSQTLGLSFHLFRPLLFLSGMCVGLRVKLSQVCPTEWNASATVAFITPALETECSPWYKIEG